MDFLFELIFELVAEGTVELSKSVKVPKVIRYPLIAIIALFCVAVIGIIFFVSIISYKESPVLSAILFIAAVCMLIAGVIKFKKTYLTRKNEK